MKPSIVKAIDDAEAAQRLAETAQVVDQPHRNGERSELAESNFGKFCLSQFDTDQGRSVYDAGIDYMLIVYQWRRAKGIPVPVRLLEIANSKGGDLDKDIVEDWLDMRKDCECAMKIAGFIPFRLAHNLILDDMPFYAGFNPQVRCALMALSRELGK